MSPHVRVNKEHTWPLLVARNLSMSLHQFCPSALPASTVTEEVEHPSSSPGYPFKPLEKETDTQAEQKGSSRARGSVHVLHPTLMGSSVSLHIISLTEGTDFHQGTQSLGTYPLEVHSSD